MDESTATKLPALSHRNSEMWLAEHELSCVRQSRKTDCGWCSLFLISFFAVLFQACGHLGPPFNVGVGLAALWLSCSFFIPIVLASRAMRLMDSGDPVGALRICRISDKLEWYLGPIAQFTARTLTDQVRAVALASRGHLVESQIVLAQWSLAPAKPLDEPMVNTVFGAIYVYGGDLERAEHVYSARYDSTRNIQTGRISKAIAACNMGWIFLLRGDNQRSLQYSEEALALIGQRRLSDWRALRMNVLLNKTRALLRLDRTEDCEALLEEATELLANARPGANCEIQLAYAELRLQQDRISEALLYGKSAVECYRSSVAPGNSGYVYARVLLARLYELSNHEREAKELLLQTEIDQQVMIEDNENLLPSLRMKIGQNRLLA